MSEGGDLSRVAQLVRDADSLALACHVGPDGDALGSMIGFGLAARAHGKAVVASFGSPFSIPSNLSFLPSDLLVPPQEFPGDPGLMLVFDAGSADRLGELAANASAAETLVVLDHHVTNEGFGDVSVVDKRAAATGELVYELLRLLEWDLTSEIANCLHTALVTDSGRFQYASTSPRTLRIAAELVEAGANPPEIGRHVYEEAPFGYLKAAAVALGRAVLDEERRIVSTSISQRDLDDAGVDWGDIDNLIDTIRLASEADVAILAKLHEDGRVKISMRSRGDTDVGGLARAMGGGGHRLAAGFTTEDEAERVVKQLSEKIGDYR